MNCSRACRTPSTPRTRRYDDQLPRLATPAAPGFRAARATSPARPQEDNPAATCWPGDSDPGAAKVRAHRGQAFPAAHTTRTGTADRHVGQRT